MMSQFTAQLEARTCLSLSFDHWIGMGLDAIFIDVCVRVCVCVCVCVCVFDQIRFCESITVPLSCYLPLSESAEKNIGNRIICSGLGHSCSIGPEDDSCDGSKFHKEMIIPVVKPSESTYVVFSFWLAMSSCTPALNGCFHSGVSAIGTLNTSY